ncbi:SRPBCC family protein [Streptomyces sp. NPDC006624]|uniref:SRPBCC family protein n=1 Tax=Streptomyces sp. NPDC006624 TaxID=3154892 RepID=UPI0033A46593
MTITTTRSRHLAVSVGRPAPEVYAYVSNPVNIPCWAPGLARSLERVDGRWVGESPMGRIEVAFTPDNDFGVLDHDVTLPSGRTVHNPMRVIADGPGCEVVFTLRRQPWMSDEDVRRDAEAVSADLTRLKRLMEQG